MAMNWYTWSISLYFFIIFSLNAHGSPTIKLSANKIKQGQTIKIILRSEKEINVAKVRLSKSWFHFSPYSQGNSSLPYAYITHVGISRKLPPKQYNLYFKVDFQDSLQYKTQYKLWVKSGKFKKEYITLPKKKKDLPKKTRIIQSENIKLAATYKIISPKKYFYKPFIMPVKNGRITSPYGRFRVYNGVPSWPHSGVDIGKGQGASIMAANTGIVVFSESLTIHGNTLVIDHGWGVMTTYNHLEKTFVKPQDSVVQGQRIATMGSTGIATGPHLHWGLSVQNIRVDPLFWMRTENLYH